MSKGSDYVAAWRKRTKTRMVAAFGGYCAICGVSGPECIFDFHHLDPKDKKHGMSTRINAMRKWSTIVKELRKCVLLCANCHRMLHHGGAMLPKKYNSFNAGFTNYKKYKKTNKKRVSRAIQNCIVCNKSLDNWWATKYTKYCSNRCRALDTRKVKNRPEKDILISEIEELGYCGAGRKYGVSDNAIRKWLRSYGKNPKIVKKLTKKERDKINIK